MTLEYFRNFCSKLPHTNESFPFDNNTLVIKVLNKLFACVNVVKPDFINLKCDPEIAVQLRERYVDAVFPAYHMNKKHWNSIYLTEGISTKILEKWITDSYYLVIEKMTKPEKLLLQ